MARTEPISVKARLTKYHDPAVPHSPAPKAAKTTERGNIQLFAATSRESSISVATPEALSSAPG